MWSYLRGEWRLGGWWYYYLYAMAVKVPLGIWVLGALAVFLTCTDRRYRAGWRNELVLLAPALAVLVLVSSQTGFNHHMRYVLPAFPFLFIWISKVGRAFELGHRTVAVMGAAALVWSAGSSLWIYPHSLSYFNESVGGPRRGHEHLVDSNIDWGQDLLYLKRWLDAHPEARPMAVAYRNSYDASVAGIDDSRKPPPGPTGVYATARAREKLGPMPGWYAISVHLLRHRHERYKYFLDYFQPVAMAGYSIYIYHITLDEANRVRRRLGLPELGGTEHGAGRREYGATICESSK